MRKNILINLVLKSFLKRLTIINFLSFCLVITIFGCKAKKQLVVNQHKQLDSVNILSSKLSQIQYSQNKFETFSGKAHTKLEINGTKYDVTFNIRIKNSEKVWISVTAIAGIEAARLLITPDSIWLINRLQGVYFKKPFNYIQAIAGSDINFKAISSVLIGNAIVELLNEKGTIVNHADTTQLTGSLNSFDYSLQLNKNLMAIYTVLTNPNKGQELQITNSGKLMVGDKNIPEQIGIKATTNTKKIQVDLHYVKVDFNQILEFPFTIPESYQEVQ